LARPREAGEVEGVLARNVDGALVGVGLDHASQAGRGAAHRSERRVVGDE
jgi:hypothetical protein